MDLQQNVNENASNNVDKGTLRISLTNESTGSPVQGAKIAISYTGNPPVTLEEVSTDDSGNTEVLTLNTPPLEYSMEPNENQPYAEYTIRVEAPGYRDITISAIDVLPGEESLQDVELEAEDAPGNPIDTIVIPAHTLYGVEMTGVGKEHFKNIDALAAYVLAHKEG